MVDSLINFGQLFDIELVYKERIWSSMCEYTHFIHIFIIKIVLFLIYTYIIVFKVFSRKYFERVSLMNKNEPSVIYELYI